MKSKKITVSVLLIVVLAFFAFGMYSYQQRIKNSQMDKVNQAADRLVRAASPVLGPVDARVTVVEFFDPACETCRAFYPFVKDLMRKHPQDIRLVLRYAPFHQGSDQVIKLLEAARYIGCLRLHFLDANTIRRGVGYPGFQAFAGSGADTVEVEAG